MSREERSESDHGLKSSDPMPHRAVLRTVRDNPRWLALGNLLSFAICGYVSVAALGGYALEHVSHDTAITNALQYVGAVVACGGLVLCLFSMTRSRRTVLRVNLVVLLIVWPAELVLTWALWVALF